MMNSNSLTVPLVLLIGCTLSGPVVNLSDNAIPALNYCIESSYQTTSINPIAKEFSITNPRADALDLFGIQSGFSPDEQKTYISMLERNSEKVGINISDLFK